MTQRGRIVSPRIVRPPNYGLRAVFALLVVLTFGAAIAGAFFAGSRFEHEASTALAERMNATVQERDALSAQVADLKQQSIVFERSQQIDREANRTASEQLIQAQDERLALEKEVSFLRRLIQDGGSGILQPKDFKVKETGEPGQFGYSFTIQQLIPDFGESTGDVEVQVVGKRDGEETTLSLDELAGSTPLSHKMKFKHFQSFEGSIRVPDDFEPVKLVVAVKPTTAKLIPISETFPWSLE